MVGWPAKVVEVPFTIESVVIVQLSFIVVAGLPF